MLALKLLAFALVMLIIWGSDEQEEGMVEEVRSMPPAEINVPEVFKKKIKEGLEWLF